MKTRLLFFAMFIAAGLVTSCSDDEEPAPPHIVGQWTLRNYAFVNVPEGFKRIEGITFELYELPVDNIESYTLNLQADGKFERERTGFGKLPETDEGTYTWEDDIFTLNADDVNEDEVFGMEKNEDDNLWVSQPWQFLVMEDAIYDTITQEYLNSISEEEYLELLTPVDLDLLFAFERME